MNMKLKRIGYSSAVVLSLASLALFAAKADNNGKEDGDKQFKEAKAVGSTLEIHITDNGKVLVRGAKVVSVSGNTVNAATTWGSAVFNWAVVTDSSTELIRRFGGNSALSEISVGDFISFQGTLDTAAASPITVHARVLKDWSIQKVRASFNGVVKSADSGLGSFVLTSEERGDINVTTSSSTQIMKGGAAGVFADIAVGAKVGAAGLYDNNLKTLLADTVKIHPPEAIRTTLEGTIKSVASTTPPATITIASNGKDYTVNISIDTSVLNKLWLKTSLGSYRVGDKMRVYGTVNTDLTVDATVVRNISL